MLFPELLDDGEEHVDRRLVCADEDTPLTEILQLPHGALRLVGQPHQPTRVVEQDGSGLGQLSTF